MWNKLFSGIFLVLFSPMMLVIALFVKLNSSGHVLYKQERVGKDRRVFVMHKFRTMIKDAEKGTGPIFAEKNDKRITRIGKFLRESNLDELSQLWNILKGEMNIVGPRPERPFFVKKFKKAYKNYNERLAVLPGITGWAQVNGYVGRHGSIEKRLEYDLFYVRNKNFGFDFKIILLTISKFLWKLVKWR